MLLQGIVIAMPAGSGRDLREHFNTVPVFHGSGHPCRPVTQEVDMQHDPKTDRPNTDRRTPGARTDQGALPDGVRGTTRDVNYTVPQDEHEGFPDPAKPDLGEKGKPRPDAP